MADKPQREPDKEPIEPVKGRKTSETGDSSLVPSISEDSDLRWLALTAGIIVVAWQAVFGYYTVGQPAAATVHTIANMGAILLGVSAVVLALVSLQRSRHGNWPALVGLALGAEGLVVHLSTWLGSL